VKAIDAARAAAAQIEGGCLCGRVRYRATTRPVHQTICHCASCRRASGAQSLAWVTFPLDRFAFVQGEPVRYQAENGARWGFCAQCGTSLTYEIGRRPGEIDITTGSLDDPEAFPPTAAVNADEKLSWT
jgi:hypothetical protein